MTDTNDIKAALEYLESDDRQLWVRMGGAIKSELGEAGFDIWNDWSAKADNYNARAAKNTWKSLRPGIVNINTLFYEAIQEGYRRDRPYTPPTPQELEERKRVAEEKRQQAEAERQAEMAEAAQLAKSQYAELTPLRSLNHDYLVNKLIDDRSLLRQVRREGDNLVIPLKKNGEITGLQRINKTGFKSWTEGMELSGSSLVIGSWSNHSNGVVLTEGYATAASIHKATGLTTIVCFAGFNLKEVAERLPKNIDAPIFIAADNDLPDKKGKRPGMEFALAAKEVLGDKAMVIEPYFSEDDFKEFETLYGHRPSDFNDLHKLHGLEAVVNQLQPTEERKMNEQLDKSQQASTESAEERIKKKEEAEVNSISPALDRMNAKTLDSDKAAEDEYTTTQPQRDESDIEIEDAQAGKSQESLEKERIDTDQELRRSVVLDHDYDHPPRQLKAKYVFTDKGEYIDKEGNFYFKDAGGKLNTAKNDIDTIRDMLDVAEAKNWDSIDLSGTQEFKRLAFIEASVRGIDARGYAPSERDLAIIEQLRAERGYNSIDKADVSSSGATDKELSQEKEMSQKDVSPFKGALREHGHAPYQFDDKKSMSYYATIEDENGELHRHWGKEINTAIQKSAAQVGDKIELVNLGRQAVEVEEKIYDKDGKFSHTQTIETHRNEWEINHIREQELPEEPEIPLAQQEAEKDKVLNQNRTTPEAVIEDSARVDEHGADIPMAGVGGNEINDEVRAFMNGLTIKQKGLNKASLATLHKVKELVKPIISGLNKEQRDQAIRNFNEKMDHSIDGQELKLGVTPEATRPDPVREYEKEAELER